MVTIDSRYVPARSPGRIRVGRLLFVAEWSIDHGGLIPKVTAVVTSHDELLYPAVRKLEHIPLRFYRGTVLIASATGVVYREEMWGGRYSVTFELDELELHKT